MMLKIILYFINVILLFGLAFLVAFHYSRLYPTTKDIQKISEDNDQIVNKISLIKLPWSEKTIESYNNYKKGNE